MSGAFAIDAERFPDAVFRQYIADHFDTDSDGLLLSAEIEVVTEIGVREMGISSVEGIEAFYDSLPG